MVRTGPGPTRVVGVLERVARENPGLVVMAGVAGGLRETPVCPPIGRVVDRSGRSWSPSAGDGAGSVTLLGVDAPVTTVEEKAALGVAHDASLVDCESHAFAEAATRLGLAWAIVRGVSDGPGESLPGEVIGWTDESGRTRLGRVLGGLIRRPRLVGDVARLGRRSARAMEGVVGRVESLVGAAERPADGSLWPVPEDARRVLIFGGTFDPPHRAHFELPEAARQTIGADWVLYVPAARSPHKSTGPEASDADRVAMLEAGLGHGRRASVSRIELVRGTEDSPSYTVDTLAHLRRIVPEATELRLLIGADQATAFHRWREAERILELAPPCVMQRGEAGSRESLRRALSEHWSDAEVEAWMERVVDVPMIDASATRVRELLRSGDRSSSELASMVPPAVLAEIGARGLYA